MDPYTVLGVSRNATPDDIKAAYRKLANKHHPDRGGDTSTFQKVQSAYDTLSDPQKKGMHDNPHTHFDPFGATNPFNDFINQFMNQSRQKIYTVTVLVTLEQIVRGSVDNVGINTPAGKKVIQLQIPNDIQDGSQIRYENIMQDGLLHVVFRVYEHPTFTRNGNDLYSTSQVNIFKLITGTTVQVIDIYGKQLEVNIPAMTKPGSKFRIPGRGLGSQGDQYVLIDAVLPDTISPDTLRQIKAELEGTSGDQ